MGITQEPIRSVKVWKELCKSVMDCMFVSLQIPILKF